MPNRILCAVLEEMRDCAKTLNFSYLLGLIEELQTLGNRMEAKLFDIKDFERLHDDIKDLKFILFSWISLHFQHFREVLRYVSKLSICTCERYQIRFFHVF